MLLACTVAKGQALLDPLTQPQFQVPLPRPATINATGGGKFTLSVTQFEQPLGLRDPLTGNPLQTRVWGYNGTFPGPTVLASKDVPVQVYWENKLVDAAGKPLPHLLPVDVSLHWALRKEMNWQEFGVPIVTHLHGGHSESASDGLPDAWYTPKFTRTGDDFIKGRENTPYHYDNDQEAATLWYHDHTLGITRLNVYAGMAGFYLLTDENEQGLKAQNRLPHAEHDLGIVIQDRMFTANGQLYYPSAAPVSGAPEPSVLPEFFGNFILVNGAIWPVLEVEPRLYRFRFLNGSDSRFYNLFLSNSAPFSQIGSDAGLLPAPVTSSQMLLGTGERKDVLIDFTGMAGQTIILKNNAKTPFPKGSTPDPLTTGRIMAFRVSKPFDPGYPLITPPAMLRSEITPLQTTKPPRKLVLFEAMDDHGRLQPKLGTYEEGVMDYHMPVTENVALGDVEVWEIYNETMDAHTIHLHLVAMQLLNRQKFMATVDPVNGKPSNVKLIGHPKQPGAGESGWKDTYIMYPGEVTRVIAKFDRKGLYAWHCHILSHEDHEMMRPYRIGDPEGLVMGKGVKETETLWEKDLGLNVLPNPFSGELHAQFRLNEASRVTVTVYDIQGRVVQKVFAGNKEKGPQQFSINGHNWASGTYYLEMLINHQKVVRKLVLQR